MKIGDGLNAHSSDALPALYTSLDDIIKTKEKDEEVILIQTGDLEAYGYTGNHADPFPGFDYWADKKNNYNDISKFIDVYGNHDVWPGGLKGLFAQLVKDFPEIAAIGEDQANSIRELLYRSGNELEAELRSAIDASLYGLSPSEHGRNGTAVDMFSVEGFELALSELRKRKGLEAVTDEALSVAVPRIFVRMLQKIADKEALKDLFALIRELQNARFRSDVIQRLADIQRQYRIDDDTILNAVNSARRKLRAKSVCANIFR